MRRLPPFVERLLFRRAAAPLVAGAPAEVACAAVKALHLAEAAERELAFGRDSLSSRLAATAVRAERGSAPAAEVRARGRLAQGDASGALAAIEESDVRTSALRLLRSAALVRLGRKDEAHHDLLQWSRLPSAPEEARLMLALLEWEAGDAHAAALALLRNTRRREEPRSLALLAALAAGSGRVEQAAAWAARMGTMSSALAPRTLLAGTLGIPHERLPVGPAPHEVETLAIELLQFEAVIPGLVAALEARPQPEMIDLVRKAVEMALPRLVNEAAATEAAARLCALRGDERSAAEWIRRGLERHPMHAGLARLARSAGPLLPRERSRSDVIATIAPREPGTATRERAA